jgi:hypothetical protein
MPSAIAWWMRTDGPPQVLLGYALRTRPPSDVVVDVEVIGVDPGRVAARRVDALSCPWLARKSLCHCSFQLTEV